MFLKKKKGNVSNISKSKKIPFPTFNLLKSEVQVQKTFLKKKRKEKVSNIFKSKKKYLFSPFNLLKSEIQVQETSLKKKKKGMLITFPNQKKIKENSSLHPLTYSIPIPV
jgi:phenylalanyl-tRNA synthetase alpha subunit